MLTGLRWFLGLARRRQRHLAEADIIVVTAPPQPPNVWFLYLTRNGYICRGRLRNYRRFWVIDY